MLEAFVFCGDGYWKREDFDTCSFLVKISHGVVFVNTALDIEKGDWLPMGMSEHNVWMTKICVSKKSSSNSAASPRLCESEIAGLPVEFKTAVNKVSLLTNTTRFLSCVFGILLSPPPPPCKPFCRALFQSCKEWALEGYIRPTSGVIQPAKEPRRHPCPPWQTWSHEKKLGHSTWHSLVCLVIVVEDLSTSDKPYGIQHPWSLRQCLHKPLTLQLPAS